MAKHNPSMKGLEMPDEMNINEELHSQLIGESFGKSSGQMSNQINMLAESNFAAASKNYEGIEKIDDLSKARAKQQRDKEQNFLSGAYKPDVYRNKRKAEDDSGIKIGRKSYGVKTIVRNVIIVIAVLTLFTLFIPPVFTTSVEDCQSKMTNIFEEKGINDVRVQYGNDYTMVNDDALSSEKYENYRELYFTFRVLNLSPLQAKVPQYSLAREQSQLADKIVYVGNDNTRNDDIIQPFSSSKIVIKVLVNVEGMEQSEFSKLVRGMIFETVEMERKVTKTALCPTLPAFLFVSDSVSLSL